MARVTGVGGIFFKAADPDALATWYRQHLKVAFADGNFALLKWSDDPRAEEGSTVFALFARGSDYFGTDRPFMVNFRVDDLDAVLAELRAAGAAVDDAVDDSGLGRFGWVTDPEGNRVELWQPPR
ncbi:MAG TPA: VOC family protein [Candidatus Elarobacter sp.]|jgi:predicted enzyme related to lactoylglutathione lyase|nr:VOC family protein [Candidatus Elarobacter sp.]